MKKTILFALSFLLLANGCATADGFKSKSPATSVTLDVSGFVSNLSSADTDVQKAMNTLDAVAGGGGAPTNATYITKTANGTLSAEFALGSLATGLLKSTTTTGNLSIAAADTDYEAPHTTFSGYGISTTSANLAGVLSDESGTGVAAFTISPTFTTPILGAASATTLDTGLGAHELYAMDQDVQTTDNPTLASLTVNTVAYDAITWNANLKVPTMDAVRDKIEALSLTSPFQTTSNVINNTTTTDDFTFGSTTHYARFAIVGATDEIQWNLRCNSTQTNSCFNVEASDGTDWFYGSQAGGVTVAGSGTQATTFGSGSQSTYVNTWDLSGTDVTETASSALMTDSGGRTVTGAFTASSTVSLAGVTTHGAAYLPKVVALSDGATISTDASLGNVFTVTLGGNRTIGAPTNAVDGQVITYRFRQDATGSRTLSWNAVFHWTTTVAQPTLTTTAAKSDYISFRYNGANTAWESQSVNLGA